MRLPPFPEFSTFCYYYFYSCRLSLCWGSVWGVNLTGFFRSFLSLSLGMHSNILIFPIYALVFEHPSFLVVFECLAPKRGKMKGVKVVLTFCISWKSLHQMGWGCNNGGRCNKNGCPLLFLHLCGQKQQSAIIKDLQEFPGGPVVRTLCFLCQGPRLNPWSGK